MIRTIGYPARAGRRRESADVSKLDLAVFAGAVVTMVKASEHQTSIVLRLSNRLDGAEINIESTASIRLDAGAGEVLDAGPELARPCLELIGRKVIETRLSQQGELAFGFGDGVKLVVQREGPYESYQITVASMPAYVA